ncbi:MAG: hypothetical protein H6852_03155 [Geminicoccaceae bacterium]|jgi:hypothetical protein|nr:hypothetical protein [Geminicoccaceae bacterium]MCB9966623.1 hypothetical protein [Geminicoccaceae bacterium]HRY23484.1 hypothetical protein [Geminicoccaceae bacterium]
MDRKVTTSAQRTAASRKRPAATRRPLHYRLLHSTGEHFIEDRDQAIDRLASLPGAKLFVLRDAAPVAG